MIFCLYSISVDSQWLIAVRNSWNSFTGLVMIIPWKKTMEILYGQKLMETLWLVREGENYLYRKIAKTFVGVACQERGL